MIFNMKFSFCDSFYLIKKYLYHQEDRLGVVSDPINKFYVQCSMAEVLYLHQTLKNCVSNYCTHLGKSVCQK